MVWAFIVSHFCRNGKHILVDPVFGGHASPFTFMVKAFKGSDIYVPSDFNQVDILILTHDHYDHLDYKCLIQLKNKVRKVVCSLGVASHLVYWGYDKELITELDWWESTSISGITLTATPARHFSGRLARRAQTLWSSFVLQTKNHQLFLGGDSGYGDHFNEIGKRFGGFDIALLECGQYNTKWPMIHMMPEENRAGEYRFTIKNVVACALGKICIGFSFLE